MSIDCEISTTWHLCCDFGDCDASEDFTVNGEPTNFSGLATMMARAKQLGWTGDGNRCFCQEHEPTDDSESKP